MNKMILSALATALFTVTACSNDGSVSSDNQPTTDTTTQVATPQFNADSAYNYTQAQCDMGPRVPGTPAHKQCGDWLESTLRQWADSVIVQQAPVTTFDGHNFTARNIIAQFNPQAEQRVLLLAHWDCRPWADKDEDPARRNEPVMGANDAASGTAVLLEIARHLGSRPASMGVDILLVDVEDWGDTNSDSEESWALGTQYWAKNPHVEGYKPLYGILLDMVGARGAQFSPEYFSVKYAPSTVQLVWDEAINAGYGNYFKTSGGGGVTDDHVPVNEAGIPCIDIVDLRPHFFDGWHTTHDTMDNIDRATLKAVGQTLLNILYR